MAPPRTRDRVLKNDEAKNLWNVAIPYDPIIKAGQDIVVIEKKRKVCKIIEIFAPRDFQIGKKCRE